MLRPGSKVTPQIEAGCVAYTQPDGEPVTAKGSAKGNTITTALAAGKNKSFRIHIIGAGLNVRDYLHAYQLEDYGPRLLIKPRRKGQIRSGRPSAGCGRSTPSRCEPHRHLTLCRPPAASQRSPA